MEKTDILFKLQGIKTEQFAILEDVFADGDSVQLESSYRFGANANEKIVVELLNYKFKTEKGAFLIIEVSCMFGIKPESWSQIYNADKSELTLPKSIATHLLVLGVGTVRGVLHAKTENTRYNKFMLPTLDVSGSIKENVTIKI